jgi:dihydroneopterin aldolase
VGKRPMRTKAHRAFRESSGLPQTGLAAALVSAQMLYTRTRPAAGPPGYPATTSALTAYSVSSTGLRASSANAAAPVRAFMSTPFPDCYRVRVQSIEIDGFLGVYDHEQAQPRSIQIEVDLYVPIDPAAAQDDELAGTVNYEQVLASIERVVGGRRFRLVESLCTALADDLQHMSGVRALRVEVTKPQPMPRARAVQVELWRMP